MVLNGDILEYENIGKEENLTAEEVMAVNALLALGVVINWLRPVIMQPLRGGAGEIVTRQTQDVTMYDADLIEEGLELASQGAVRLGKAAGQGTSWLYRQGKQAIEAYRRRRIKRPAQDSPVRPNPRPQPIRGGSSNAGAAMLAWKNSLTKMYHTYQTFNMSPVLCSIALGGKYVHRLEAGNGPHLYWVYSTNLAHPIAGRSNQFNDLSYWDGGFGANPSDQVTGPPLVPKKNFRTGATGTVYVFNADWPGTIMNHDPLTQDTTNQTLNWIDFSYGGTVTTTNYPRTWVSVFANTNWQYLTVYGIQYRFDVTNLSSRPYMLEISLFKFKADIDAMDYEKQCLAHFGGYHTGTNAYCQRLSYLPMADVNIVKTKRYRIHGMDTHMSDDVMIEGNKVNNRTIKWNIKRSYVMKRPLLNSYETTLTEKQIYTQYYEAQKGLYFRFMAWPEDIAFWTNPLTGSSNVPVGDSSSPNVPVVAYAVSQPTALGNGLQISCYKKAYFKLDENTATF